MRRIGKRASYSLRNTVTTSAATSRWTIKVPVCTRPSKPRNEAVTTRRSRSVTGQPGRQETPVILAASAGEIGATEPANRGDTDPTADPTKAVAQQRTTMATFTTSRGGRIRTDGFLLPKQAL